MLEVTYGCASWNHPATGKAEILRFRTRLQAVRLDLHVYSLNYLLLVIRELFFFSWFGTIYLPDWVARIWIQILLRELLDMIRLAMCLVFWGASAIFPLLSAL